MGRDQLAGRQSLWVEVDTQHKRILVGVPMGSATQPNEILGSTTGKDCRIRCRRARNRPNARANGLCGRSRRIPAALVERSTGVAQIFFGSNDSTERSTRPLRGAFSDDGAPIHSFYTTAYLAATGISGRNLFGYLTATCKAQAHSR